MTKFVFTVCSNNYLGQAIVLGQSVILHEPGATFVIVLADKKSEHVDYTGIPFEVLPGEAIEPQFDELARKYHVIEINTCIKPRVFEYLFEERRADTVVYLDPDIRVYAPLREMDQTLEIANVVLTPHITSPIARDGKLPTENLFLTYGVYNLGFMGAKRSAETLSLMRWWKERTYAAGYIRPESGMFVDQLYINLVPMLFKGVSLISNPGYNMAPWNFHERVLSRRDGAYWVNQRSALIFFHFSAFRVDSGELPVHFYNRFAMRDRPDLAELYADYNEDLKRAGHDRYSVLHWGYREPPAQPKRFDELRKRGRALARVGVMWSLQRLPPSVTERAYKILKDFRG